MTSLPLNEFLNEPSLLSFSLAIKLKRLNYFSSKAWVLSGNIWTVGTSNLRNVVLTFESVDGILKCDHSNEIYRAVLSCDVIYYDLQGDSSFRICG